MDTPQILTFNFSQEEILLISMKLRFPLMIGLEKSLLDLPKESMQIATTAAEHTLVARDFLRKDGDGNLKLIPIVVALIGACSKPERSIIAICTGSDSITPAVEIFHFTRQMIVNQAVKSPGVYSLTALTDKKQVLDGITQLMNPGAYQKPDCPVSKIPGPVFGESRKLAHEMKEADVYTLLAVHMPKNTAVKLGQTLLKLDASITVAEIIPGKKPGDLTGEGFTFLLGDGKLWVIQQVEIISPDGENLLSIEPISADDVAVWLEKLIH